MISSTTSDRLPFFTHQEIKAALIRTSTAEGRSWGFDVFPCPVDLFEILVDIIMLQKTYHIPDISASTSGPACSMMEQLKAWQVSDDHGGIRKVTVEIWRFGIMVYLHKLFPFTTNPLGTHSLQEQALRYADLVPPTTSWSYSLLWPLFQIGLTLGSGSQEARSWIVERLEVAHGAVGCRHFCNAIETLQFAWNNPHPGRSATGTYGRTIMLG
jgi:hypothetical protein